MLASVPRVHIALNRGEWERTPVLKIIWRVFLQENSSPARKNIKAELIAWAKTKNNAVRAPLGVLVNRLAITILICTTDEYAIRTLKSLAREQTILNTAPPHNAHVNPADLSGKGKRGAKRKIPKAPNFKSTPAKSWLPAAEASTCALGSHKWKKNRGNLTIKPKLSTPVRGKIFPPLFK